MGELDSAIRVNAHSDTKKPKSTSNFRPKEATTSTAAFIPLKEGAIKELREFSRRRVAMKSEVGSCRSTFKEGLLEKGSGDVSDGYVR